MTDDPPLTRQWTLLRTLSARHLGVTVRALARALGVGEKTVRRDLDLFRRLGFPLEEVVGERGCKSWKVTGAWHHPPLGFSFDEAVALDLGRRFLEPLAGTRFWDASQRVFRKIRASLGKAALEYIESFGRVFHHTTVGASDYSRKAELIDDLMVAVEDRKAVHIAYRSQHATEPATRDVYPYGLIYHRGSLYLVAFALEHNQVRHYKVDRVESIEVSPVHFQRPEGFDLAAHTAGSFGVFSGDGDYTVRVRFAPPAGRYVLESNWHASQRLTRQKDGCVIAEFRLSGLEEVKSWVLRFGSSAVVLEPEPLRAAIRQELKGLEVLYRTAAAPGRDSPGPVGRNGVGR
jgi:predicted DNA-binding transcriptional regulator YafY